MEVSTCCKDTRCRWLLNRKNTSPPPVREGCTLPLGLAKASWNATAYFQATMPELLEGPNCMVWVDDVIYWAHDEDNVLNTLDLALECLEGVRLFATAHKCIFNTSITWCGKVYSGGEVKHNPERLSDLTNLRRPETS